MIRTALITAFAAAALVAGAAGAWLHGAGTARAPEPAVLAQGLGVTSGATAAATFLSGPETSVVKWPGTWTANTTLQGGQPCSTVSLAPGEITLKVIQANGNYRKCM